VALLTSGGDAPGMNAGIRAAAKIGVGLGFEVLGVEEGYAGLIEGRIRPLDWAAVEDGARRGGTILGSARSRRFMTAEGQAEAKAQLERAGVGALVVFGGNGSLTGARALDGATVLRSAASRSGSSGCRRRSTTISAAPRCRSASTPR
jgi:6-phosphofructokinase 1